MKTIYLCGGINKLSDADAKDWREETKRVVMEWNEAVGATAWATLDPMRRDYRGVEAVAFKEIVRGDLEDIANSDIMLVNASRPSWGTAMEVFHAAKLGRRVIGFGAGERPSPWLIYHCDALLPDLASALAAIRA